MSEWWDSLGTIGRVFACFAIPSTILLLIQTVMTMLGFEGENDADGDVDADVDGDGDGESGGGLFDGGVRIFTIRGFVAFFSVMGWTGIVLTKNDASTSITLIVSIIAGSAAMFITGLVLYYFLRLQSDGSIDNNNTVGLSGTVYMTIPAKRAGRGKINLTVQGRYSEFDAVTSEEVPLTYGTEVEVVALADVNTLVVKSKK